MDAKAKVVAWRYRDAEMAERDQWHYLDLPPLNEYAEVQALIPLTDHEAALAELRTERDEMNGQRVKEITNNLSLLSGLEALAGEWEEMYASAPGEFTDPADEAMLRAAAELRERIRTLTNSAKGGA